MHISLVLGLQLVLLLLKTFYFHFSGYVPFVLSQPLLFLKCQILPMFNYCSLFLLLTISCENIEKQLRILVKMEV